MKKRKVDPWFPFWIDKWLHGSTVIELEPDERGIFVSLMALSKKDDGWVRANEGVPYLKTQLCGLFNCKEELLDRTMNKCIKYGKIQMEEDGTFYMTSHEYYKLSPRQTRRIESEMADDEDDMADDEDIEAKKKDSKNKIKLNKELKSNNNKEKETPWRDLPPSKRIKFNYKTGKWEGILVKDIKRWSKAYPKVDIILEVRALGEWLYADLTRKKSNYAKFIANNLSRKQDKGGTRQPSGQPYLSRKDQIRQQTAEKIRQEIKRREAEDGVQ